MQTWILVLAAVVAAASALSPAVEAALLWRLAEATPCVVAEALLHGGSPDPLTWATRTALRVLRGEVECRWR